MNSLAVRLFFSATVWIIFTLVSAGLLLSDLNKKTNFKAFDDRLHLLLETLIGSSRVDSSDGITVVSTIGDPRFFQPYSGWYWQINNGAKILVRSRSMWDQLFTLDKRLLGGRAQFVDQAKKKTVNQKIIEKKKLHIVERKISFPGIEGPITFIVSGDIQEYETNIREFDNTLLVILVALGFGLMIAVFLQVKFGLLPLNKIKDSLFKVRNGDEEKLKDPYPLEVQPLATEINELLDHNSKIIDRAKTHVGNLAHVLKTPLAVISNEIKEEGSIMNGQVLLMKRHINRYLKKAHLDSVGKVSKEKINLVVLTKKMILIFKKLYPEKNILLDHKVKDAFVLGGMDDMEEVLGNIIENACKYGNKKIKVEVVNLGEKELKLIVSDDGLGLSMEEMNKVFARGFRLDEQTPGTGLGLNIVKDIVETYLKGKILLRKSKKLGGLEVNIFLPLSLV
ncbi:MAG: HAMP domain-containing sensor histidine kinase [Pseudomonadota bacterium]|nr:HAMP domain-containing sensor histidine kinase [Pseudomonadota bacterium]